MVLGSKLTDPCTDLVVHENSKAASHVFDRRIFSGLSAGMSSLETGDKKVGLFTVMHRGTCSLAHADAPQRRQCCGIHKLP